MENSLAELLNLTTINFACDDQLNMNYSSDSKSQPAQDTASDARAAVIVHPERSWRQDILGLQMRGAITEIHSQNTRQEVWKLFQVKFPYAAYLEQLAAFNQSYEINPHWIRLVNNRRGFGFKGEWGRSEPDRVGERWDLITGKDRLSGGMND